MLKETETKDRMLCDPIYMKFKYYSQKLSLLRKVNGFPPGSQLEISSWSNCISFITDLFLWLLLGSPVFLWFYCDFSKIYSGWNSLGLLVLRIDAFQQL